MIIILLINDIHYQLHCFYNYDHFLWQLSFTVISLVLFNSSHLGQNGRHFADHIFKCIFMNEKICISIRISLKFFPKCPIDKKRIGSGNGLALNNREAIIWIDADPVHRRIYASLGGDVLSDERHSMATDKLFRIVCLKRHHCVTGPVWLIWNEI